MVEGMVDGKVEGMLEGVVEYWEKNKLIKNCVFPKICDHPSQKNISIKKRGN